MRKTGAVHLVTISGMHVTMLAGVAAAIANLLWRRSSRLTSRLPARKAALAIGLTVALLYAVLAGFRLPIQRAIYMLVVAVLALLSNRVLSVSTIWCLALAVCVGIDPWAVLSVGFWLSFLTVGALLWATAGHIGKLRGWREKLRSWRAGQWAATLGSAPVLIVLFQQLPLASPLAYASAIPLACAVVTPLALLGSLDPTGMLLRGAHVVLDLCLRLLVVISHADLVWRQAAPPLWTLLPAALAVAILLLPRAVPGKLVATAGFLPLLFPFHPAAAGSFRVVTLDVGQGLSVLVRTAGHALLFEAGTGAGGAVPPALQAQGVRRLDMLLSEDGQADAVSTIAATLAVGRTTMLAGDAAATRPCGGLGAWDWDGVRFTVETPGAEAPSSVKARTAARCVLKVSGPGGAVLLAGNIGRAEQNALLGNGSERLRADIMLMPHHGAAGAWSAGFLDAVQPKLAIASVGYLNPFHQPRNDVVAAYQARGVALCRTDRDGAVTVDVGAKGWTVGAWRDDHPRYWDAAHAANAVCASEGAV